MSEHYHALVWIDHQQAKIFHFATDGVDLERVTATHPHQHLHHKANSQASGHAPVDVPFLRQVADALIPSASILITGPGSAKAELSSYIQRTHPDLARRISGIETVDHPTDAQLLAHARSFFKKEYREHAQVPPRGPAA